MVISYGVINATFYRLEVESYREDVGCLFIRIY